ncbi:type II toxin-antitoxin system RelE/ParE family toxin [uncultured Bradyrhizobium sp.]|uniref:type II toxin-antitoxin system RelE/ParE family toxin n=1 Tax=uncultured Bradyrhizobium sp. TaxID=199684 RepID=UPI0035CB87D5
MKISDAILREAVRRAERGLVDADLGGGVIKQRVARPGQGRSAGFRVLLAYRPKSRSVFLFGFAKSARGNVEDDELETAQEIAGHWLDGNGKMLAKALAEGVLEEVDDGEEEKD